jgi:hypothetical protein
LIESAKQLGVLNVDLLARGLAKKAGSNGKLANELIAEVNSRLSLDDQTKLMKELPGAVVERSFLQWLAQSSHR